MRKTILACVTILVGMMSPASAQIDEDQLGAWYMYFWNTRLNDSRWGFQGDGQYRNWDLGGDLEQLLLRAGVTYTPASGDVTFTFGYANITSGEFGDGGRTSGENRTYQEMLLPQQIGQRYYLRHRFRFEQRWVEGQDFRTRYRYSLFADIPLNRLDLRKGAIYLSLYDELFINGQRDIGDDRQVELFDRNRLYGGVGYSVNDRMRVQVGYMEQTTDAFSKGQLQFSFHHTF